MTFPEVCGWLAGALTMCSMLPQAARVWRYRHDPHSLLSLSVPAAAGRLLTMCLWLTYTAVVGAVPLMIANLALVATCAMVLVVLVRARRLHRLQLATGLA
ncbi:MAG: hypothetical protein JWR27_1901 [Aeromicrobium sp.]|nr:hypothetical protein [Aeromicrobium sp.]